MNKEELEKEAEEKYHNHKIMDFQGFYNHHYYYLGYVEGAESIEKQINWLRQENVVLERRIERAKECMKKLLFIINSDPANYNCKGLVQDAEDFIHNRTCNIRQLGEHCISETRCIMCDMEDKRK